MRRVRHDVIPAGFPRWDNRATNTDAGKQAQQPVGDNAQNT